MAIPFFISRQTCSNAIYVEKYPASLWKHKDAKHTKVRYECEVCNARFVSQEYLNTHNGPYVSSGVKFRLLEARVRSAHLSFVLPR